MGTKYRVVCIDCLFISIYQPIYLLTGTIPPQVGAPPSAHGLTPEQQQLLLMQVQQQHHQIMKLQEQVKSLSGNGQQQQQQPQQQQQQVAKAPTPPVENAPVFVAPPSTNSTKLRHSEAYLRFVLMLFCFF